MGFCSLPCPLLSRLPFLPRRLLQKLRQLQGVALMIRQDLLHSAMEKSSASRPASRVNDMPYSLEHVEAGCSAKGRAIRKVVLPPPLTDSSLYPGSLSPLSTVHVGTVETIHPADIVSAWVPCVRMCVCTLDENSYKMIGT